jgi:polyisoprenyl-teichoic acid--peptidoglycan teichoic acid transferase
VSQDDSVSQDDHKPEPDDEKGKKWRKARGPMWARILVVCGAMLMVISGGTIIGAKILVDQATAGIEQVEIPQGPDNDSIVPEGEALRGAMNILLVGVDDGQTDDARGELRTGLALADSIMILHVPETHDQGYIVSLPRDLWISIPKYPATRYGGGKGKLNSAYTAGYGPASGGGPGRAGGLDLLMQTINQELKITFNAAVIVNFTGFTAALKQLGGVTMYIDERVTSVHYGTTKQGLYCVPATFDSNSVAYPRKGCEGRVYERGERRLSPEEALDYTRQREWMELDDGDYGRQRHQQQFIKALAREAKNQGYTTNLSKSLALVKSVGSALTMWTNGAKLEDWFFTLKDIAGNDIVMVKTNRGTYHSAQIESTSAEALSSESRQMLAALRDKKLPEWLLAHPDWIGRDAAPPTQSTSPRPSSR